MSDGALRDGAIGGPGAPLAWERGGEGALVQLEGERARVRSSIPSAPGSRLQGTLSSGPRLRIKVQRCRRLEEPGVVYELEGRLIDLTREAREAMVALLGAG